MHRLGQCWLRSMWGLECPDSFSVHTGEGRMGGSWNVPSQIHTHSPPSSTLDGVTLEDCVEFTATSPCCRGRGLTDWMLGKCLLLTASAGRIESCLPWTIGSIYPARRPLCTVLAESCVPGSYSCYFHPFLIINGKTQAGL